VRLGSGVSGKVAASGQSVFLKGTTGERRLNIHPDDLINPEIDTSYIVPIQLHDGTLGTINVNSTLPDHEIEPGKELLVQRVLHGFSEYLYQIDFSANDHEIEIPSQLYMLNIFREYSTLRELRVVFDYIFHLITDLLKTKKKGIFLLKNQESGFFDLILGYGLDTKLYRKIYEELIPQLQEAKIESTQSITMFHHKELFSGAVTLLPEKFYMLIPLIWQNNLEGHILLCADEFPILNESIRSLIQSICESAGRTIKESSSERKFKDLASTDSLTGMYNYGLWWKRLHEELTHANRLKDIKVSLIVFDIDQFDRFNRDYGYFLGDQILRAVADKINSCLRTYDIAGRIGSDEFGIALPNTEKQNALNVANRILDAVSGLPTEINIQMSHPLTLSGGVAQFPNDAETSRKLVENAKTALVSAKIMGGNCIKSFEHLEE
jgi:diguanylate cyclase (GGDEF)-like protein